MSKHKKKKKIRKSEQIKIPEKIHEIISYLAFSFKSKLLERDDIKQDLYVVYLEMLKKDKRARKAEPGYFFKKFKWFLLTKFRKEVNRKNKEWEYVLRNDPEKSKKQSRIGYISDSRKSDEE